MLLLLVAAFVAFFKELFPLEVTAFGLLGVLLLSGLVTPAQAVSGFSNKAVVAIGALFVLSHGLAQTGLVASAAERLAGWAGERRWLGIAALLAAIGLLSGFLNNTAMVAIFIPLTMSLCSRLKLSPSRVLIPLSYASIFGGTLTLIGTSTNLLVSSIAEEAGEPAIGMFELTPLGAVFLVFGLAYIVLFARRLLPERVPPGDLTSKYRLGKYLTEVRIRQGSKLAGSTCKAVGVGREYGINALAVLRGGQRFTENVGVLPLVEGDELIVQGGVDDLLRMRKELDVALLPDVKLTEEELAEGGQVTTEALVPPTSSLIGRTLTSAGFRARFGGFVMAIRRHARTRRDKVAGTILRAWDALLILVPRDGLERLRSSPDLIVLAEAVPFRLQRPRLWWLILALLPLVILVAALGILEIAVSALLGAIILLLSRVLKPSDAYGAVDWSVLFLIAAFVPVGHAFLETGTADFIASGILRVAGFLPLATAWAVLALLYLTTSLLTQIVSNAAAAIILAPIAMSLAATLGVDSRPFLVAICFAASAEFMTPMGYQTNMMVYSPGGYRFLDYTRFGAPLNLGFWLIASLLIPRIWPF